MRFLMTLILCSLPVGCVDIRSYAGDWQGSIVEEPALRAGFATQVRAEPLRIEALSDYSLDGTLTTSDGSFRQAELRLLSRAQSDVLGSLTFDGDPLRSYLLSASPDDGPEPWTLALISLFGDEHVELRLIRQNDRFGIFYLERAR